MVGRAVVATVVVGWEVEGKGWEVAWDWVVVGWAEGRRLQQRHTAWMERASSGDEKQTSST